MKVAQAETVLVCVQELLDSNVVRNDNIPRTGSSQFKAKDGTARHGNFPL
jgi:hypothetical protein